MANRPLKVPCLEIEVTTNCNWRCVFCPVRDNPKPADSMDMEMFEDILKKAYDHGTVKAISMNAYNEPTLDPLFMARCEKISYYGFKLNLHTNGSNFTDDKISRLKELNMVNYVVFNLPTLDKALFEDMTRYKNLDKLIQTYEKTIAAGFFVSFNVNGTNEEIRKAIPIIRKHFSSTINYPHYNLAEPMTGTHDRAGELTNKYAMGWDIPDEKLVGCVVANDWLYISVKGDLYVCCQDYKQKTIYGNIYEGSITEILNSPRALDIFAQINGQTPAEKDLICRKCMIMGQAIYTNKGTINGN